MRGSTIVEAVAALALGLGAGAAFLFASGELPGAEAIARLEADKAAARKALDEDAEARALVVRLEKEQAAELKRRADARAAAEAVAKAAAEAEAAKAAADAAEAAKAAKAAPVEKLPAFGLLTVKSLSGDLAVEAGPGRGTKGKSVELAFEAAPGKVRLSGGAFKVDLTPRVDGKTLNVDVSVNPMAIITADGNRVGTSAPGLKLDRKAFKLDFNSPVAGELNLLLTYKK